MKAPVRSLLLATAGFLVLPAFVAGESEPIYDSRGIPYEAIESESTLGTIKAYNPGFNFLVAQLVRKRAVEPGTYVALRRDGVIVCFAYVEALEPGASVATLELLLETTGIHPITNPALGDQIIRIPPYGKGVRYASDPTP